MEEDSEEDVESTSEGSGGVVNVAKLGEEEQCLGGLKSLQCSALWGRALRAAVFRPWGEGGWKSGRRPE